MTEFIYPMTKHCLQIVHAVIRAGQVHNCDISECYVENSCISQSCMEELFEFGVTAQETRDIEGKGLSLSWTGGEVKIPDEWYE